jgi:hypothetical protein
MYSDSLASPGSRGKKSGNFLPGEVKVGKGGEGKRGLGSSDLQDI